jgi:hypothetical protein
MKKEVMLLLILVMSSICIAQPSDDYMIAPRTIEGEVEVGGVFKQALMVRNTGDSELSFKLFLTGNITDIAAIDSASFVLRPQKEGKIIFNAFGDEFLAEEIDSFPAVYSGSIDVLGDILARIPVKIMFYEEGREEAGSLVVSIKPLKKDITIGRKLKYVVDLKNVYVKRQFDVNLTHNLLILNKALNRTSGEIRFQPEDINVSISMYEENFTIRRSFSVPKDYLVNKSYLPGEYVVLVRASYLNFTSETAAFFDFEQPWLKRKVLGPIRTWMIVLLLSLALLGYIAYRIIKSEMERKKRFHAKLDFKEVPKEGPRSIFIGMIAETKKRAYFDMDVLTVHSIVAGSTGGGKSIAAQDIVEECLIKGAAVVVFDPTAQWSGMLRKCTDKKMLSFYGPMGMKAKEARPFPGNIRAIFDAREIIEIQKYWKSGEIQVFTTNTLDPKDYDLFVANTVRQIFKSNLQEYRGLRFMLVYDEIHRILPKFGGSGQGFVQIERGCREFRKWGIGILLVSQVLSDFVGQIKANINTNVQMKTRDESDLSRIKMNYGEEYIHALIKAPVGSGMVQNSAWNRGKPYYVTFRPILHSVVRLSDEELEQYNKFNDVVDDIEFQLEQLDSEGQDTFDLKLELKLCRDKIKSGNFNMVQIYLDGLTPRVDKLWTKIGRKPKKLERKLVDLEELQAEFEAAKAEKEQAAKKEEAKAEAAGEKKEEKKEEKMDPEMVKANIESMGQLAGQVRGLIAHQDWMSINDLLMEISGIPLPEEEKKKRDDLANQLKLEMQEAKSGGAEKKEGEEKKEEKKA